jgi:hypothetical protein
MSTSKSKSVALILHEIRWRQTHSLLAVCEDCIGTASMPFVALSLVVSSGALVVAKSLLCNRQDNPY